MFGWQEQLSSTTWGELWLVTAMGVINPGLALVGVAFLPIFYV